MRHSLLGLAAVFLTLSMITSASTAVHPQITTDDNGLSENESATLWSRDTDQDNPAHRFHPGNETPTQRIAAQTDITFKQPPSTAATWTQNDYHDFEPGGQNTSVYPEHANRTNSTLIKDAHSTIFAVQPSTRAHLNSNNTPLYIAPNGTIQGTIDYRIEPPAGQNWTQIDGEVTTVRLKADDEVIARTNGTQTPEFDYAGLNRSIDTLTIEAEIEASAQKTTPANQTETPEYVTDTIVVSDDIPVTVYDLDIFANHARYPNGDIGVAIYQNQPWQSYQLSTISSASVRGVWRFYTARDPRWDRVIQSSEDDSQIVKSDAIPVYVHAFPSVLGPQAKPTRTGPDILSVWGIKHPSPANTIGKNVHVGIVNSPYTTSYGVAVRHYAIEDNTVTVHGIVRGVNSTIEEPDAESKRQIRRSNLTMTILESSGSQMTVRVELRDAKTGRPIGLETDSRRAAIIDDDRSGYITIADKRVRTNRSGVAITTVEGYGSYTARYQPESWLSQDPAYIGDRATVQYHPLLSVDGWLTLLVETLWQFVPFLLALYAGVQLSALIGFDDSGRL